jgi:hypothetical protein
MISAAPGALGASGFDDCVMRRQSSQSRVDLMPGRTGDEHKVRIGRGIVDTGRRTRRIHQDRTPKTRLRRDERLLRGPELAVQRQVLGFSPEPAQNVGKFASHLVAAIMLDVLAAEHARLARRISGHHVDPPTPTRDVVDCCAKLGNVEGMPRAEQHVDRRDQQDPLGHRAERRYRDERIERVFAIL